MARGSKTGVGRRESNPAPAMKKSFRRGESTEQKEQKKSSLVSLTLDCQQDPISGYTIRKYEWKVEILPTYKRIDTILKREEEGKTIIYDLTYHGPGNKFVEKFPNAVSEWDFMGFCYYEDNPLRRGNFKAKIIS